MSDETGRWTPYNKDGSSHDCRSKTAGFSNHKAAEKQQETDKPSEITIAELLDRLSKVGVNIDIKTIMNPKKEKEKEGYNETKRGTL